MSIEHSYIGHARCSRAKLAKGVGVFWTKVLTTHW